MKYLLSLHVNRLENENQENNSAVNGSLFAPDGASTEHHPER